MKLRRLMLLGAVVVLSAGWARANTVPVPDPGMIIVHETFQVTYLPLNPGTTTFQVIYGACGGSLSGFFGDGCAFYENDTGNLISSIGLSVGYNQTSVTGQALSCFSNNSGNPMDTFTSNNCPATVPVTNPFSIVYFGGPGVPTSTPILVPVGTTDPSKFAIVANLWGLNQFRLPDINVNATLNAPVPVPEPATMTLLLTGVGVLAARRKLRKGRGSRA